MPSSVKRAVVDQQRDPLARGQLVGGVLPVDLLLPPAEPQPLARGVQLLDQRPQDRGRLLRGAHSRASVSATRWAWPGAQPVTSMPTSSGSAASAASSCSQLHPPSTGNDAGISDGSSTSRSRWTKTGPVVGAPSWTPWASISSRSSASMSRTPTRWTASRVHREVHARVPDAARGGQRHAPEEAAGRRVGGVEVGVGVQPGHADAGVALGHRGQRRDRQVAVPGDEDLRPVLDRRARGAQHRRGGLEVGVPVADPRRLDAADRPRAQQLAELAGALGGRVALGRAPEERYRLPRHGTFS